MTSLPTIDPALYAEALALACRFYAALDANDATSVSECFAEDGVWHRPEGAKVGADAVRAVVVDRPIDQTTAHCVSNLRLRSGNSAYVAEYYLNVFGSSPTTPARLFTILDCSDELVNVAGLGLRIRSKRTAVRLKFPAGAA